MQKMHRFSEKARSPLLAALTVSFAVLLLGVLLGSLLLMTTNMKEAGLLKLTYAIHGFSVLIGAWNYGKKKTARGLYAGGLFGLVYWVIVLLVGFLALDANVSLKSLNLAALCLSAGCLGGVIGVNTARS